METFIKTKDSIKIERLLLELKIYDSCPHKHTYEDYCMVCSEVIEQKGGETPLEF